MTKQLIYVFDLGGVLIRLCNVHPNRNFNAKKQYPFFARYEIVK